MNTGMRMTPAARSLQMHTTIRMEPKPGLPTFQVFPWLLAYHAASDSDYTARSHFERQIYQLGAHSLHC